MPNDSNVRPRNLNFERGVTREVARRACVDASELIRQAEHRASSLSGEYVRDPLLVSLDLDRLRETLDELVDARNHLVFWIEDHLTDPRAEAVKEVLLEVVLSFDMLTQLLGERE